jgi:DNA polymerase III subunit alpha
LIAAVAMYRPGPLGAGLVATYIRCKHGEERAQYYHPAMQPILEETHGLILYQEQVQALAQELAHFTLSEGDLMRRAMGKKIKAIMDDYREKFIAQAKDTVGEEVAEKVFEQIDYFAGYGFNKSHSACYAYIAYQTAYLKCHHPKEYMAALLTIHRGDSKKVVQDIKECRRQEVEVLPPDVNESDAYFTVVGSSIRFGLAAVKGVGDKAVEGLVEERQANGPYKGLHDFCTRVDLRLLNKGSIEALIKAGAFDSMGGYRAQTVAALESALAAGGAAQKDRMTGQMGLFGAAGEAALPPLPDVPRWTDPYRLAMEKEVLGFYVSSHPLARYENQLQAFATATTSELAHLEDQATVTVGGLIAGIRLRTDRNENRFAQVVLEDMDGAVTVMLFHRTYERVKGMLEEDRIVFVQGRLDRRQSEPSIIADNLVPLEAAEEQLTQYAVIQLAGAGLDQPQVEELGALLESHRGDVPLQFRVQAANHCEVSIRAGRQYAVRPSRHLVRDVTGLLGEGHLLYNGKTAI